MDFTTKPRLYRSPIKLDEAKSGPVSIKHRYISGRTDIVSMREALLTGQRPAVVELDTPLRIHELHHEQYGVWMTDLPQELNQIGVALQTFIPCGRVLVGGLGLGILAATLATMPLVRSVTVIERDLDIIKLCATSAYHTVHADLFDWLKAPDLDSTHECYMLDTWQGTNENTWWREVMPLKRLIRNRYSRRRMRQPRIWCWAENIMRGQIMRVLTQPARHWHYEKLPLMSDDEATFFVQQVGTSEWEKRYSKLVPKNTRTEEDPLPDEASISPAGS